MSNQPSENRYRFKILIVDDVPKNIQVLGSLLFHENLDVTFASNGHDAITLAKMNPIDLILLDVMMPGMDGFETCKKLKENPATSQIPVIFMTALNELQDKISGFQAGAVDFITKPFESEEVLARVKSQLKIRALQSELEEKIAELEKKNRFITSVFGTYLSDEIVENILEDPAKIKPGGEVRTVSILMADLRGFSSSAETLSPTRTLQLLNLFIGRMTGIILSFEGTIDEVLGDALLVIFGAPLEKPDHADRAIACALAMQNEVIHLNRELRALDLPEVQMGVGINSGEVIVGNIGSSKRLKYGVVGRNVNLTARIESFTVGFQTLVSEQTVNLVKGEITVRDVYKVNPKGVRQPVHLFDIIQISGNYNVILEQQPPLSTKTIDGVESSFEVMEESESDRTIHRGTLKSVSVEGAILDFDGDLKAFSNLKMNLLHRENGSSIETVYSKVINRLKAGEYRIVFTSHFILLEQFIGGSK